MTGKNDNQLKQVMAQGYAIDFDVHYLVQKLDGDPKIFGWVSGDEQALLRKHGIG